MKMDGVEDSLQKQ